MHCCEYFNELVERKDIQFYFNWCVIRQKKGRNKEECILHDIRFCPYCGKELNRNYNDDGSFAGQIELDFNI